MLEKVEERNLLALRDRDEILRPHPGVASGGNHALQDYQMQLLLLEQQNKKRLLMGGEMAPSPAEGIAIEEPAMFDRSGYSLREYQARLTRLEEKKKKTVLMAREGQDTMAGPIRAESIVIEEPAMPSKSGADGPRASRAHPMHLEQQDKKKPTMAGEGQDMTAGSSLAEGIAINEPVMLNRSGDDGKTQISEVDLLSLLDNDVLKMGNKELQNYLQDLQARAKRLRTTQEKEEGPALRYQILYRILQEQVSVSKNGRENVAKSLSPPFFDAPEQFHAQGSLTLKCRNPVRNFELFLEQNKDVSFIVYRTYISNPPSQSSTGRPLNGHNQEMDVSAKAEESIRPVAQDLVLALETILESREEYADMLQQFRGSLELYAPYLFMYHHRSDLDALRSELEQQAMDHFTLFSDYVIQQHGSTYASADAMISQGRISTLYVDYLFKPGDVLISRHSNGYRGWVASSWARETHVERIPRTAAEAEKKGAPVSLYGSRAASKRMANDTVLVHHFTIQAWFWDFDGNFQRRNELLKFTIQAEDKQIRLSKDIQSRNYEKISDEANQARDDGVPIDELRVFPIKFASPEVVDLLRQRGKIFWQCRVRRYVSYCDKERDGIQSMVSWGDALL